MAGFGSVGSFLYISLNLLMNLSSFSDRRLCGDDYITHSRCFVYIQKNLDWDSAIQYCGQNLSKPGLLASIEDKSSQILVQGEVNKNSGNDVWINGYRNYRRWRWQGRMLMFFNL